MAGINKRIFGSDISLPVKQKLAFRQSFAESPDFGQAVEYVRNNYPISEDGDVGLPQYLSNFNTSGTTPEVTADLSSRTPFVRMWTAVEIQRLEKEQDIDVADENESDIARRINEIKKDNQRTYEKKGKKLIIKKIKSYERIVYELNNHINNEFSDVLNQRQDKNLSGVNSTDVIPNVFESNKNQFIKPAAGITSITSNTEGMLGAIKKTTINFVVHNFHDYDKIYSRYFLRPGAQIFVDFGWDSIDELYKPQKLIDTTSDIYKFRGKTIEEALFGEKGYVTQSFGDLETLIGFVTSFDSKIKENGSVECTLEIVSKNAALINGDLDDTIKNKLKYYLDLEIMNYASLYFDGKIKNFLDVNYSNSAESFEEFQFIGQTFAASALSKQIDNQPTGNATITGVFWKTFIGSDGKPIPGDSNNIYISLGVLEDKILNNEFGVGDNITDILGNNKTGGKFDVRFDSSESFTSYSKSLLLRQKYVTKSSEMKFLYPYNWGKGDMKPYNISVGKVPTRFKEGVELQPRWGDGQFGGFENEDKKAERIPLREIFISLELIKKSMNVTGINSVKDYVEEILNQINKDSGELFDLQLSSATRDDSKLCIIDRNFLNVENNDNADFFEKLFIFKPMSKNSIVKSYDLSLTTPKGDFQSMLAIQTIPTGKSFFPLSSIVDKYLSYNAINDNNDDLELGVSYIPNIGSYQTIDNDEDQNLDSSLNYNFNRNVIDGESDDENKRLDEYALTFNSEPDPELVNDSLLSQVGTKIKDFWQKTKNIFSGGDDEKEEEVNTTSPSIDELTAINRNVKVANSIHDFFKLQASRESIDKVPSLLSFANLSLSIYGISSLVPGDVFRVDYLPERQRKFLYFQITKITHSINSSTWTTQLETVPRINSLKKSKNNLFQKADVILSSKALDEIMKVNFGEFKPLISMLTIIPRNQNELDAGIDYIFQFESYVDKGEMKNINNDGNDNPKNSYYYYNSQKTNFSINDEDKFKFHIVAPGWGQNQNLQWFEYDINFIKGKKYKILVKGDIFIIIPSGIKTENYNKIINLLKLRQYSGTIKKNEKSVKDGASTTKTVNVDVDYYNKPEIGNNTPRI